MRRGVERGLKIAGGAAAGLVVLVLAGILVLTQTDWGRERVRRLALDRLLGGVHGRVHVGGLHGNLLRGMTLTDLAIRDSAGAPFLSVDTLSLDYSLRDLVSKRLYFHDVRLVRPIVTLAQPPGGTWNYVRIFPTDTPAAGPDSVPGFGSWVRIRDLVVRNGRVVVRNAWSPPDSLTGEAREQAVRDALALGSRAWVIPVDGGWQVVRQALDIDAVVPLLQLADPELDERVVVVDSLSTLAFPYRPPAAEIRQLAGRVVLGPDSARIPGARLVLPGTELRVEGAYAFADGGRGGLRATLEAPDLAFADLRFLRPSLPSGGGSLAGAGVEEGGRFRVVVERMDLHAGGARVAGSLDAFLGDTLVLGPSDLRVSDLDTRLVKDLAPGAPLPVEGVLDADLRLSGTRRALEVDGSMTFTERDGGTSRVAADGGLLFEDGLEVRGLSLRLDPLRAGLVRELRPGIPLRGTVTGSVTVSGSTGRGFAVDADLVGHDPEAGASHVLADGRVLPGDGVTARDLEVRLDPLQVGVAQRFVQGLPVGGTLTGRATLNGTLGERIGATLDVTHHAPTGPTRAVGEAAVALEPAPRLDVDLRLPDVSLATVGRFVPSAGLRGRGSGHVTLRGPTRDLRLDATLDLAADGAVEARGRYRSGVGPGARPAYDLVARFSGFDPFAVSPRAPAARLTGTVSAQGAGTDPATATATVEAHLADLRLDTLGGPVRRVDSTSVLVHVEDGLLTARRAVVRLDGAVAEVRGTLGLVAGRSGTLHYRIDVDSLDAFDAVAPADTAVVQPRPARQARRIARARADSAAEARATEVERLATGRPPPPELRVDTLLPLPVDSLAGAVHAEGTLTGSLDRLGLTGTAVLDRVVAGGNVVGHGELDYTLEGFGRSTATYQVDGTLTRVAFAGYAFDTATVDAAYTGVRGEGEGRVDLALVQDSTTDYGLTSEFRLALDRNTATAGELRLHFDSTRWTSTGAPGRVAWGGEGLEVHDLTLASNLGGRMAVDGALPVEGPADLRLDLEEVDVADLARLVQDTVRAGGRLSLHARLEGPRAAPRLRGDVLLAQGAWDGRELPRVTATFDYADTVLTAEARLVGDSVRLMTAEARLPVDLSLTGVEGSRLRDGPMDVRLQADSLPLNALPSFTDAVTNVHGRLRADLTVQGTFDEPALDGAVDLDLASLDVVPAGLALRDIAGTVRFAGDTARVDSLVAHSRGGAIRVGGAVGIASLGRPTFDLSLRTVNALVMDNERGHLSATADLALTGSTDSARVTGDVDVTGGVIYLPEAGGRRVTSLSDPRLLQGVDTAGVEEGVIPRPNPLLQNLSVDLTARVERNTWARNTSGNVEIYTPEEGTPLRVTMVPGGEPGLEGVINADRGEYAFMGHRFEVTTGSATFLPGRSLDPMLQITAQYEVPQSSREALVIQIHVLGTATSPRVTLESNAQPPLPESDIIAYLAFGRSSSSLLEQQGSGLAGGDSGGGALGALGAVARQQISGLAMGAAVDDAVESLERRGNRAGLDVFRIHPAELPSELSFDGYFQNVLRGTELEAGKYLSRRLFVAVQGRLSQAVPGLRAEYRTPSGFSWVTTWEPRYLPGRPTLAVGQSPTLSRSFASFLRWKSRF